MFDFARKSFSGLKLVIALSDVVTWKSILHCHRRAMVARCKLFLRWAFDEG